MRVDSLLRATTRATIRATTDWLAVATAIAAGITAATFVGKIAPALPALKDEFGLSLIAAGWFVAIFNIIAATGAIFIGLTADRLGSLRLCLFGLVSLVLGGAGGAVTASETWLLVSRIVEGLGFVAVTVSAPGLISAAATPADRALALGYWSSYMPIGAGLALAVAGFSLDAIGWRGLWWSAALTALVCAVALWLERHRYDSARGAPRSLAQVRASLAQPVPWLLGLAFGMYTLQWHAIMVWLPTYLTTTFELSAALAAWLTLAYVLINIIGNTTGGRLVHAGVARGKIIAGAFTVTSVLFVAIFNDSVPPMVRYALVLTYSAATGVVAAAVLSGSARYARHPSEVGSIQGLLVQVSQWGVFISPLAIAFAVTWGGGWQAALWVLLSAGAIGLVTGLVILRFEQREASNATNKGLHV